MTSSQSRFTVNHLIAIDESASMQSIEVEVLNSVNSTLRAIRSNAEASKQDHRITILSFNSLRIRQHYYNRPVEEVNDLRKEDYNPNTGTPLMDALGVGIGLLRAATIGRNGEQRNIVTLISDGEENGSEKYGAQLVSRLIMHLKQSGWIFNHIAAKSGVSKLREVLPIDNHYAIRKPDGIDKGKKMMQLLAKRHYQNEITEASKQVGVAA